MWFNNYKVSIILFILGVLGVVVNRRNLIIMLMSIELILLAISFMFIKISKVLDNISGLIFTLLILTVAAAESAIGLALFVVYYRIRGTIGVSSLNLLRG